MGASFNYDSFDQQVLGVVAQSKGKTFAQLSKALKAIRRQHQLVDSARARKYINRKVDRYLQMFALDTGQPRSVVETLYKHNVKQGFTGLHAQMATALEYAACCEENGDPESGVDALREAKRKMRASKKPGQSLVKFIESIDNMIRLLEAER